MKTNNLKRVFSFAITDFNRNKGVSLAAIFVLVVMITLISGLLFFHGISRHLTSELEDKIDISAYFKEGVTEEKILEVREQILSLSPNIRKVEYISKDQALEMFTERYQDNPVLSGALNEVGINPFLPSLNITTNGDPAQYAQIDSVLQNSDFSELLEQVDFTEKKDTIEKIYSITERVNTVGIVLAILLLIIAVLVVLNTLRLAIDGASDEISTMRIVGASDWFIKGPFVICGAIYGVIAFIISFLITSAVAYFLTGYFAVLMPGFSLFRYLLTNLGLFVLIQLLFGVGVGVLSSFFVVRKYLR